MNYISMFSGIEAASAAWHPLGWKPLAFAEIEKFPSAVLAHHWPGVPNLGDITKVDWSQFRGKVDVVIGGPPCQAFSVAGLRESLEDARGILSLEYIKAVHAIRPRFVITENVPGWLSTKDNAFGCFLAGMVGADSPLVSPLERGRWTDAGVVTGPLGVATWRVLNAQYFGVAQRRRRVFVVADFGNGAVAASVLFERKSGAGDFTPRGETREGLAPSLAARTRGGGGLGTDAECDGALIPETMPTLRAGQPSGSPGHGARSCDCKDEYIIPEVAWCLQERDAKGADSDTKPGHLIPVVAHSLRADGFNASEDGTGRGTPLVPVEISGDLFTCADCNHHWAATEWPNKCPNCDGPSYENVMIRPSVLSPIGNKESDDLLANTIGTTAFNAPQDPVVTGNVTGSVDTFSQSQAVAVSMRGRDGGGTAELTEGAHPALRASQGGGDKPHVLTGMRVRRLTPRECERLQGFPDNHTLIPWRGKPAEQCPDGPRYKAIGNSMAVPVIRWLGERLEKAAKENDPA